MDVAFVVTIVNLFRVLRDPQLAPRLLEQIALTPYVRDEFDSSYEPTTDAVESARRTAVRACMGFGSAGATKGSTGFRMDTARTGSTAQHVWAKYPASLLPIIARLQGVMIENRPAIDVIAQHDAPDTLHFIDPPYLRQTRVLSGNRCYYRHEMSDEQHLQLLAALRPLRGMVVLCGYPSALYDTALPGWSTDSCRARISAIRGAGTRTEQVWLNPAAAAAQRTQRLC